MTTQSLPLAVNHLVKFTLFFKHKFNSYSLSSLSFFELISTLLLQIYSLQVRGNIKQTENIWWVNI